MIYQGIYNSLLAQKLIGEFAKRNIEGFYCENRQAAVEKILEIIPESETVSCGGSQTLRELGLHEILKEKRYNFLDPDDAQGGSAKDEIAHQALAADYFLMSANAVSMSGELVNVDGYGNRVAALIFGPKHVLVIAGLNKVEPDLATAVLRVKNFAAPLCMLLFKQDYVSYDELAQAAAEACRQMVITRSAPIQGRIKVILVGENLGF
ncbi:MAG: lactate utilization protein [Syntrophomonadaceae bacterium]|jgi:L-lactate utilization protein LutB|nr:lactate utilization protein [Syntrophomonadaceae bacterium]